MDIEPRPEPAIVQRAQRWRPRERTRRSVTVVGYGAIGVGVILTLVTVVLQAVHGGAPMLVDVPVLLLWGLCWALVIRRADRPRVVGLGAGAVALGWGACVAPILAQPVESVVQSAVVAAWGRRTAGAWWAALGAPPVEEGLKLLGVVLLAIVLRRGLRSPVHGLLLGAWTGLGFAVVEDIGYVAKAHGSLSIMLERTLTGLGSHVVWTALTGLGLGVLLTSRIARRGLVGSAAIVTGVVLHFLVDAKPLTVALVTHLRPMIGLVAATVTGLGAAPLLAVVVGALALRWATHQGSPVAEPEHRDAQQPSPPVSP